MWCPQHNQYCYEDTCPHGGPRPEVMRWKPPPYPATPTEREALAKRQAALGVLRLDAAAAVRDVDAALAALVDVEPLAEYGVVGTYDTVQARRQRALAQAARALLDLRRKLSTDGVRGGS